jgi:hypothetical protein
MMQTFELRQYTMQPGKREEFVTLFDREFCEPQEEHGARIVGQFRDLDDPNRFVWIRGHDGMPARKRMMHAFYDGDHWKQHRGAANDCIADSDNVLLLTPAWEGSGFAGLGERAPVGSTAPASGTVVAQLCYFASGPDASVIVAFREAIAENERTGARFLAALVTEPTPNNFPRHPLREGEHVFAWFWLFDGALTNIALPELVFAKPVETLLLRPTPRSRLRA